MNRSYYLDLAAAGQRMPIGTHLTLHTHPDPAAILLDAPRLAGVIEEAARHFGTPLGVPVMDLTLEKESLLTAIDIPAAEIDSWHFETAPEDDWQPAFTPRMQATCGALTRVAEHGEIVPVGMSIGPFSLMTKLVSDPITPVFLAGSGITGEDDPEVRLVERALEVGLASITAYLEAQAKAGAKAIILCEPAANMVYFSPNQLEESYEVFEKFVMEPNRKIKALLERLGVDLIFHDCGELQDDMIRRFVTLDPAILSLGSSRQLWNDAPLVPNSTVLFGNMPTKKFYSDTLISLDDVKRQAAELLQKMSDTGHPFILGSECDVLSVPGAHDTIMAKVEAFLKV